MSILTLEQTLASLEHRQIVDKIKQRKLETRKKIEWGELVVKSGMSVHSKEIILGSLIDTEEKIRSQNGFAAQNCFREKGKKAFSVFNFKFKLLLTCIKSFIASSCTGILY